MKSRTELNVKISSLWCNVHSSNLDLVKRVPFVIAALNEYAKQNEKGFEMFLLEFEWGNTEAIFH